jgi:hypothetical protein
MFPMAPDDRLRVINRCQEAQRTQVALERMAKAVATKPTTEASGPHGAESSGRRNTWTTVRHLLTTISGPRPAAPGHAAR